MGFWDKVRGEFVDVIEWTDDTPDTMVYRFERYGNEIKYESGHQRDNLGFWTNPGDWADWEFNVTKPGKFEVSAEIAGLEKASLEISVGNSKTSGAAAPTGDYGKFKVTKFGVIEIPAVGKATLAVRPVKEGWHAINLKAIRLKPAAATN